MVRVLASGFEEHYSPDGEGSGDADDQRADVLVIGNPAALEIKQLEFAGDNVIEEFLSLVFVESKVVMRFVWRRT